jgi:hypothetical protein
MPDKKIYENWTWDTQHDTCKMLGGRSDRHAEDFHFANAPNQRRPDEIWSKIRG